MAFVAPQPMGSLRQQKIQTMSGNTKPEISAIRPTITPKNGKSVRPTKIVAMDQSISRQNKYSTSKVEIKSQPTVGQKGVKPIFKYEQPTLKQNKYQNLSQVNKFKM